MKNLISIVLLLATGVGLWLANDKLHFKNQKSTEISEVRIRGISKPIDFQDSTWKSSPDQYVSVMIDGIQNVYRAGLVGGSSQNSFKEGNEDIPSLHFDVVSKKTSTLHEFNLKPLYLNSKVMTEYSPLPVLVASSFLKRHGLLASEYQLVQVLIEGKFRYLALLKDETAFKKDSKEMISSHKNRGYFKGGSLQSDLHQRTTRFHQYLNEILENFLPYILVADDNGVFDLDNFFIQYGFLSGAPKIVLEDMDFSFNGCNLFRSEEEHKQIFFTEYISNPKNFSAEEKRVILSKLDFKKEQYSYFENELYILLEEKKLFLMSLCQKKQIKKAYHQVCDIAQINEVRNHIKTSIECSKAALKRIIESLSKGQ